MEQAKFEKIAETFKDEKFMKRIMEMEKQEEIIKAFAEEQNITLSEEEVNEFIQRGQEIIKQIRLEKIVELMKDKEFVEKIAKIEKKEDIISAFAEKGLELSVEEIDELVKQGQETISSGKLDQITEALSEDKLENISGGTVTKDFKTGVGQLTGVVKNAAITLTSPSTTDSSEYVKAAGTVAIPLLVGVGLGVPALYKAGKGLHKRAKAITNMVKKSPDVNNQARVFAASVAIGYLTVCGAYCAASLLDR